MKKFLLFLIGSVGLTAAARDFTYNQVVYTVLNEDAKTCMTAPGDINDNPNKGFSGDLVLPSTVSDGTNQYTLVEIGEYSFSQCENITSVTFPNTVSVVRKRAFMICPKLDVVTLGANIKEFEDGAFNGTYPTKLDVMDLDNWCRVKLANLIFGGGGGVDLYANGKEVTNVVVPDGVVELTYHFYGTQNIKTVVLPNSLTSIGSYCFSACKELSEIKLSDNLESIGMEAFQECLKLKNLVIPASVKHIDLSPFTYCEFDALIFLGSISENDNYVFSWLSKANVYCTPENYDNIRNKAGEYFPVRPFIYADMEEQIKGLKVKFSRFNYKDLDWGNTSDDKVSVSIYTAYDFQNGGTPQKSFTAELGKEYSFNDLMFQTDYVLQYNVSNTPWDGTVNIEFSTASPELRAEHETTQTTIKLTRFESSSDNTAKVTKRQVDFLGQTYDYNGGSLTFKDLDPGVMYNMLLIAYYGDEDAEVYEYRVRTKSLNLAVTASNVGPTSAILKASYDKGDAVISKMVWDGDVTGSTVIANGLLPKTKYTFTFAMTTDKGYTVDQSVSFTTDELSLTTLSPRCTTISTANVAAQTNIANEEVNAGFQWKKYDAPASLEPNQAYAIVFEGTLEGQLKNLQATSYYNVRAFYKAGDGTYFYGDWVTFDPSDFSYFDPTVRTYGTPDVDESNVTFIGYALPGTDDIIKQGFEYWLSGSSTRVSAHANDVYVVEAKGQVMTVTVNDLPNGQYTFHAFVTTSNGTYYGEDQTFEIAVSGVEDIFDQGVAEKVVMGYYDLNGFRHDKPFSGLNIIIYSDGTHEKVFVRQ